MSQSSGQSSGVKGFGLVGATVRRDLTLAARNPGEWLNPLMFCEEKNDNNTI